MANLKRSKYVHYCTVKLVRVIEGDSIQKKIGKISWDKKYVTFWNFDLLIQVVLKDGEPLGFGIIEYAYAKEAESSLKLLNGHKLQETSLRVTYCIPGKSAVEICTRLLTKFVSLSHINVV